MDNTLRLASIASLLDGRHFFIPAYQRGYRWKPQQVEDLLGDLYEFAVRPNKPAGSFYCLQPLVVRQITDHEKLAHIYSRNGMSIPQEPVWEVADGQQRLTTLLILMKCLGLGEQELVLSALRNRGYEFWDEEEASYLRYGHPKGQFQWMRKTLGNGAVFIVVHDVAGWLSILSETTQEAFISNFAEAAKRPNNNPKWDEEGRWRRLCDSFEVKSSEDVEKVIKEVGDLEGIAESISL